jgi:hypothetical protein
MVTPVLNIKEKLVLPILMLYLTLLVVEKAQPQQWLALLNQNSFKINPLNTI